LLFFSNNFIILLLFQFNTATGKEPEDLVSALLQHSTTASTISLFEDTSILAGSDASTREVPIGMTTTVAAAVGEEGAGSDDYEVAALQQQQGLGLKPLLGLAVGGSLSCDVATGHMMAHQLSSGITVVEHDGYSRDYEIVEEEILKQGLRLPMAADAGNTNKAGIWLNWLRF
jgi:hypothetical protein